MIRKLVAILALVLSAGVASAQNPGAYTSGTAGVSVTDVNTTVTFTDNHSGGTTAAFLARQIIVRSRAASANTCFLDYNDGTATTADVPLAPGGEFRLVRGAGYRPESGWASMGVICSAGQTATFDIIADRYGELVSDQVALAARVSDLEEESLVEQGALICNEGANAPTTGTSKQTLATCTIPAGSLPTTYKGFEIHLYGEHVTGNGNSVNLGVDVGSMTAIVNRISTTSGEGIAAVLWCSYGGVANKVMCHGMQSVGGGTTSGNIYATSEQSLTLSSDITINFFGTSGTQAGDVKLRGYSVVLVR
jgi:hypothetical protein